MSLLEELLFDDNLLSFIPLIPLSSWSFLYFIFIVRTIGFASFGFDFVYAVSPHSVYFSIPCVFGSPNSVSIVIDSCITMFSRFAGFVSNST